MAYFHTHGPHSRNPKDNPFSNNCTQQPGCPDDCVHISCRGQGKLYNCQWHDSTQEYRCWHEGTARPSPESLTAAISRIRHEVENLEVDLEVFKRGLPGKT